MSTPNSATIVAQQADDPVRGDFEAGDIEDLRTDVAVQPDQPQVIGGEHPPHRGHRRAAGHRQPELLVFVCGGDELVRVRLDADGETDEDVLDDARLARDGVESLDLGHRIQNDVADTGFDRGGQFGDGFVVAVKRDSLWRKVGVQRDGQFTAGAHVERQAFLVDPAGDFAAQEGFGGVVHVGPPPNAAAISRQRERKSSSSMTNSGVPYSCGASGQCDPGNGGYAGLVANSVARPDIRRQSQQLLG